MAREVLFILPFPKNKKNENGTISLSKSILIKQIESGYGHKKGERRIL
jgi:hypothetical protein